MNYVPRRLRPLVAQFAKFGTVGAIGFVVDVGSFNLLRYAGGEGPLYHLPITAKVISSVAATVVAWVGNRYWTFRHTRRQSALTEFLLFAVVAAIGTGIALACLWLSHYVLDLTSPLADNISTNGVGLGLALLFRFWAYRRHVFSAVGDGSSLAHVVEEIEEHAHPNRGAASVEPGRVSPAEVNDPS